MNQRWMVIAGVILIAVVAFVAIGRKNSKEGDSAKEEVSASSLAVSGDVKKLYDEATSLEADGKRLEAKATYQKIMSDYPDFDQIESIQKHLGDLNIGIITSNIETPESVMHEVQPGDSLGKIAKQNGTTVDLIKKSNSLKSDVIRVGQRLRVWKGQFNIFVDKSQNILILKNGSEVIKVYNVSTGANNNTPVGTFKITTKLADPVWFKSGAVVPPQSPDNVLGTRWMGFDIAGYGIHGTTEPDKIGQQVTAGCVRMRNAEVEELYDLIPMGTLVQVID